MLSHILYSKYSCVPLSSTYSKSTGENQLELWLTCKIIMLMIRVRTQTQVNHYRLMTRRVCRKGFQTLVFTVNMAALFPLNPEVQLLPSDSNIIYLSYNIFVINQHVLIKSHRFSMVCCSPLPTATPLCGFSLSMK